MLSGRRILTFVLGFSLLVPVLIVVAQTAGEKKYRRAKQPNLTAEPGIFFDDVLSKVVGERPSNLGAPPRTIAGAPTAGTPADGGAPSANSGSGWSKLISATTLEDEVKATKLKVDAAITTPTRFRSRDYESCRQYFSVLAMMFGIIEEYDANVRWKDEGTKLREAFARAAGNCKTGSPQAYSEAKLRKQDLQDAIGGGAVNLPEGKPREDWELVIDRSPLMQRLELAQKDRLKPMTASAGSFRDNAEDIFHEAQMIAAMSEVLQREGMMDADDDDYNAFCESMKEAALSLIEAVKAGNYDQAGKAAGNISKSCDDCHELYRG